MRDIRQVRRQAREVKKKAKWGVIDFTIPPEQPLSEEELLGHTEEKTLDHVSVVMGEVPNPNFRV